MGGRDRALLAQHWAQLRRTRGTVLLGGGAESDALDPAWFVDGCPLVPAAALDAIQQRHGFASREAALAALRALRDELRARGDAGAALLSDLP